MAAGLGYIEFATGDILTAAVANGYLASQTVMVFASASARTSAITSPQEGMVSYLKDTNAIEYYSGSAWVAVGGGSTGGKVLQVVSASYSTNATSSSATYADTGLTATITPSATTSKVLVLISQNGCGKQSADTNLQLRLMKNGSQVILMEDGAGSTGATTTRNFVGSVSTSYLDSPASTSALTYKTQFANVNAAGTVGVQYNSSTSTITLMEIGA